MENNYFDTLNSIKCVIEQKNGLNYISWSDAWAEVKKIYPNSTYIIYENSEGFPFWESKFGIDVKVGVTINGIEHIVRLPVMDGANKSMKFEAYTYKTKWGDKTCEGATTFDINKTIQRAFAKAIAMHGLGLYVFRGEDLPEEVETQKQPYKKIQFKELAQSFNDGGKDYANEVYLEQNKIYDLSIFIDKIKSLGDIYKQNQAITDDDINNLWSDEIKFAKEVRGI